MTAQNTATGEKTPIVLFRLRLTALVALGVGGVAAVALAAAAWYLTSGEVVSYADMIRSHALGRRQVLPVMALVGLTLVACSGLILWLVALYSSFRVAGPLHRFGVSLRRQVSEGPTPLEGLREGDGLERDFRAYRQSVQQVQRHWDEISELVDLAVMQLQLPEPNVNSGLDKTIRRLKELERRVRV